MLQACPVALSGEVFILAKSFARLLGGNIILGKIELLQQYLQNSLTDVDDL